MPFRIIRDNLTHVRADALVNTANPYPVIGSGTDRAVYEAAGREALLEERKKIGDIAEGDAAVTPAFSLDARIIIHAVSPVWIDGKHDEVKKLSSCYTRSMELALENECESIAFPLMAAGSNGFPNDIALRTALDAIQAFLFEHELEVILVVFDKRVFELSSRLFTDIREYILEHEVNDAAAAEYEYHDAEDAISNRRRRRSYQTFAKALPDWAFTTPQHAAGHAFMPSKTEDTFQKHLFDLIDESGKTDPEIYKKANLDRKHFAKIRKDENYRPKRETAIALALALELSLDEAQDLIGRAGYTISMSTIFDMIIRYAFENELYDIYDVNAILFDFDQPTL